MISSKDIFTVGYWAACPSVRFEDLPIAPDLQRQIQNTTRELLNTVSTLDNLPQSIDGLVGLIKVTESTVRCTPREAGQIVAAAGRLAGATNNEVKRSILASRELWNSAAQRAIESQYWNKENDLDAYMKGLSSILPVMHNMKLEIGDSDGEYFCEYLEDGSTLVHLDCIGVWGLGVEAARAIGRHETAHSERGAIADRLFTLFKCQTEADKQTVMEASNLWLDVQVNTVSVATARSTQSGIEKLYCDGWIPQALINYNKKPSVAAEIGMRSMARALGFEAALPFPPSAEFEDWWKQGQAAVQALASHATLPISQGYYDYAEEAKRKNEYVEKTAQAVYQILESLTHLPPPPQQLASGGLKLGKGMPQEGQNKQAESKPMRQLPGNTPQQPGNSPGNDPKNNGIKTPQGQPQAGNPPATTPPGPSKPKPVKASDLKKIDILQPIGSSLKPGQLTPGVQAQLQEAAKLAKSREKDASGNLIRLGAACRTGYHIRYPLGPLNELSARYRSQENTIRRKLEKLRKNALSDSEDHTHLTNAGDYVHNPQLAKALLVDPEIDNYWLQAPPDKLINHAAFLFVLDVSRSMVDVTYHPSTLSAITPMCIAMLQAFEKAGFRTGLGCFSSTSAVIYSPNESPQIKLEKMTKVLLSGQATDADAIFEAAAPITGGTFIARGTEARKAFSSVSAMIESMKKTTPGSLHVLYYTDGEWQGTQLFDIKKLPHVTHTVCCFPHVRADVAKLFGQANCVAISKNTQFMEIAWNCLYNAILREGGLLDGTTARTKFTRATRAAVKEKSQVDYRWRGR